MSMEQILGVIEDLPEGAFKIHMPRQFFKSETNRLGYSREF